MIKIIEIWRKETIPGLPIGFTLKQKPVEKDEAGILLPIEGPVVSSIVSSMEGEKSKIYRGHCYIVSFAESQTKRVIPAGDVVDIAFEDIKKEEPVDVPKLQ
jgi:hypothetical protein